MIRASLALALTGLAASQGREPLVRAPFVGCTANGQVGTIAAPRSGRAPALSARNAARLAYYADTYGSGVLAPRGWHCAVMYGSSGSGLIVVPDKVAAKAFTRLDGKPVRGPFVWAGTSFGGTSGRGSVMEAIARYFPTRRDFIQRMRKLDLVFSPLPTGPYPHDIIRQSAADYVRLTTPAWRNGEGTGSLIAPNATPVEGVRRLVGSRDEPDLWGIDVRLPANQADLTRTILANSK